jgi:hypothetical protein
MKEWNLLIDSLDYHKEGMGFVDRFVVWFFLQGDFVVL